MASKNLLGSFADSSNNSVVSTVGDQSVAGIKTFADGIKVDDAAGQSVLNSFIDWTSFSPNLTTFGGGSYANLDTDDAFYLRINNAVTIRYSTNAFGTSGTISYLIFTLPFASTRNYRFPIMVRTAGTFAIGSVELQQNSTECRIYTSAAQGAWAADSTALNQKFWVSFTYKV